MDFLILLNKDVTGIVITVVIVALLAIAAVILILFLSRNRSIARHVNELSKRYDTVHSLLIVQIENDLQRVYNISQLNDEYESTYEINADNYNEILTQEDSIALEGVNYLNRLLSEKKYKLIKEELDDVTLKIAELEEKCSKLNESLNQIISNDDKNREDILKYRREFREIKDNYDSKRNELKYLEQSFISVFDNVEMLFTDVDNLLSGARYVEAKEKIPDIEKVINALTRFMNNAPKLTTNAFVIIPNAINELIQKHQTLLAEGYPLHHIKFQNAIDSFNVAIEKIQKRLIELITKNVEYELNQIRDAINTINSEFDNEINSKNYYNDQFDNVYNGSYKLENKFIKLKRSVPEYKQTYLLKESCVEDLSRIQLEINELGSIKRTLDIYVHSSSQQPFSILANKLKDLNDAMKKIEDDISNIHVYLNSLRNDTNEGYEYFKTTFIELKKYECIVRNTNVQAVQSAYQNEFKQCYAILNDCGEIFNSLPLNVCELNNLIAQLKVCFESLKNKVLALPKTIEEAENAIIYANQYRQAFDDVKTTLLRAEKMFFEGDFERTTEETVLMIKKIKPETGK